MRRLILALLVGLACAAPPAAMANPALPHDVSAFVPKLAGPPAAGGHRRPFETVMTLPGRGRYEAVLFGLGRTVGIEVARRYPDGISVASYVVRGTVSRGRLEARFGSLGSISMRFRPAAGRAPDPPRCRRRSGLLRRHGLYAGHLAFRGEDGYVSFDVRRAKGEVLEANPRCRRGGASSRPSARASSAPARTGLEYAFLDSGWKHGIASVSFLAAEEAKPHEVGLIVNSETSRGRMAITRIALLSGARGVVEVDDALTSGRVSAPAPFHGAGSYAAAPDGTKTWKGKLSVDLLGEPDVPLTGPDFDQVEVGRASGLTLLFLFLGIL